MNFGGMKAAIVGFGGMGQRHFKAYQKIGCPVVSICDTNPYKITSALPDFPPQRAYDDIKYMIDEERPDILSVVTNGPSHADIARYAVENGVKFVLVEKPVATKIADAEALRDAVEKTGAHVSVNHIRRWSPNYRKLMDRIGEGLIGEPRHSYHHCGSTGLGNFATHFFDLMRMVSGSEAAWVSAGIDQTGTPNVRGPQFHDPGGFGMVMFHNGFRGFLDCSEDTGVQYMSIIAGTYGRVIIDELNASYAVRMRPFGKPRECPLTQYPERMEEIPFRAEPHDIPDLTSRALKELLWDGPVSCTVEDGIKSLELVIAFHESHDLGNARVALPLTGRGREREILIA